MTPAIETRELTKRFRPLQGYRDLFSYAWRRPEIVAVDGISLSIGAGELFGLLGQNGAGKTTLIRMLSTTLLPTSGAATVGGHDVEREPRAVRRRIGVIAGDERSFYLRLTGRQNLEFFAALMQVRPADARPRIAEHADRLGLAEHLDRPFSGYSSGMRQKLSIIRGLLTDPDILFMDEPTRSLDPISANVVRRFVVDHVVAERGCTVILATHSTIEVEEVCHRLALIRSGKLVAVGTINDLRARVAPTDGAEIRVRSVPDGLVDALRRMAVVRSVAVSQNGTAQKIGVGMTDIRELNQVLTAVIASGAQVTGCSTRDATLEQIYLAAHADEGTVDAGGAPRS